MWREQEIIEWLRPVVNSIADCCHSVKHMAVGLSDRNKMVLWPGCGGRDKFRPSHKERAIGVVPCKKEGMLLQPLQWCCADCVIHHERDVREE